MLSQFDRVYKRYDKFMEMLNLYKTDEIVQALDLEGSEKIADIGGGTGRIANEVSRHCRKVYVVDESSGMLSMVEEGESVEAVKADALNTGFIDGYFDVVMFTDVIHHIKDQEGAIKEAARILKPGGKILVLDFEKRHIIVRLLYVFELLVFGRMKYRSFEGMKMLLGENRFDVKNGMSRGFYYIITGEKND